MSPWQSWWRQARREIRSRELRPVLAALLVAVAAATGVLAFAERIESALSARSGELLGADLVLSGRSEIPAQFTSLAENQGLDHSRVVAFPSVIFAGENSTLVEIKAVQADYPLRGVLRSGPVEGPGAALGPPAPGEVDLEARAMASLGVKIGDLIDIGNDRLRIRAALLEDPEGGASFVNLAPRALLRVEDVERLGLLGPGSRAFYRLLLAGPAPALARFETAAEPLLKGQRLTRARDAEQQLAEVGRQTRAFFGLAALAVLWLAALAIALCARRYTEARREAVAQMRCMGLSQRRILLQVGGALALYALPAALLGVALGYALQLLLVAGLAGVLATELPPPGPLPAVLGLAVGMVGFAGFTLPALTSLSATPPMALLRRGSEQMPRAELLAYPMALGLLCLAIFLLTGEGRIGLIAFLAFTILAALLAAVVWFLLGRLRKLPLSRQLGFAWRQGLRGLAARPVTTLLSTVSLGLALAAILLLGVVSRDLVAQWRIGLGPDTPNRFLLNIQPDQTEALSAALKELGVANPDLRPFAVGRLSAINGKTPNPDDYADPRAARFIDRNQNISWSQELPAANRIIAGQWWTSGPEVSVAENWAQTLGLKLGDELTITVGDRAVSARITSIRAVDWDSFRVNFFLVFKPETVGSLESTSIASVRLDPASAPRLNELARQFPNVSIIDIDSILSRVLAIVEGVIQSLSVVFWCALAAAVCVLLAALAVSAGARRFEAALWRSFGASRATVRGSLLAELSVCGALGGILGGTAALVTAALLAAQVFEIDYRAPFWLLPAAAALGAALTLAAGWWVLRGVSGQAPAEVLKGG